MAAEGKAPEQVFISYSSRNRRIAEAIRSHLEGLNVSCWMAPESIMPGDQWAQAISTAISSCRVMVLLTSDSCAAKSEPKVGNRYWR